MNKRNLLVIGIVFLIAFGIYFYSSYIVSLEPGGPFGYCENKDENCENSGGVDSADEVEMQLGDSPEEIECKKICKAEYDNCIAQWLKFQNCWAVAVLERIECRLACTDPDCWKRCTREFLENGEKCRVIAFGTGPFEASAIIWKHCENWKEWCENDCEEENDGN